MIVKVGVLESGRVELVLHGSFHCPQTAADHSGEVELEYSDGGILFLGKKFAKLSFDQREGTTFTIKSVVIGKEFHWQERQDQRFEGCIEIIPADGKLVVVNRIELERYIYSVISSEMSPTSPLEFLKAHAVISRSWLLATIGKTNPNAVLEQVSEGSITRWYERDSHTLFDVCADDHCQRYQGLPSVEQAALFQAIEATSGEVLMYEGEVCDSRFSKCCGGQTERFSACWADVEFDYLPSKSDSPEPLGFGDLRDEVEARRFILAKPDAFCNTQDPEILSRIFNRYDRSTTDFFRWQVSYTNRELSDILRRKSGIDFGEIEELVPLERASSGRIVRLRIVGSKRTLEVGKELEIRRMLSESHLYSSAFSPEKHSDGGFTLRGAGWGHGVGLCQVGAAVMAERGYSYKQILQHYYPKTEISKIKTR